MCCWRSCLDWFVVSLILRIYVVCWIGFGFMLILLFWCCYCLGWYWWLLCVCWRLVWYCFWVVYSGLCVLLGCRWCWCSWCNSWNYMFYWYVCVVWLNWLVFCNWLCCWLNVWVYRFDRLVLVWWWICCWFVGMGWLLLGFLCCYMYRWCLVWGCVLVLVWIWFWCFWGGWC